MGIGTGLARAYAGAQGLARDREAAAKAEQEKKALEAIQMAALEAGLSERGIVPASQAQESAMEIPVPGMDGFPGMTTTVPSGRYEPLGQTGRMRDTWNTPDAKQRVQQALQQRQRAQEQEAERRQRLVELRERAALEAQQRQQAIADQIKVHQTNRRFDVANPMPSRAAGNDGQPKPANPTIMLKFAGEYESDPVVKDAQQMAQSVSKIRGAVEAANASPQSAAAHDISTVYNFMKMQDPGSTVREGEYATAQNAGGLPNTIRAQYNALLGGGKLTPAQRAMFLANAITVAKGQQKLLKSVRDRHSARAQKYQIDPNEVTFDPFEVLEMDKVPGGTAAGRTRAAVPPYPNNPFRGGH